MYIKVHIIYHCIKQTGLSKQNRGTLVFLVYVNMQYFDIKRVGVL